MKRTILALAAALLIWSPVLAQEPPPLEARNVACEKNERVGALSCTYEIWSGVAPINVDDNGDPVPVQQFVSYDSIRAYVAEGDTLAQAKRKAIVDAINAKLMAERGSLDPVDAAPEGMTTAAATSVPMDPELSTKRGAVRSLRKAFVEALRATAPDPDNPEATIPAPDCPRALELLTKATTDGADPDEITRATTAYTNTCGTPATGR